MDSTGWLLYESKDAAVNKWFIDKLIDECRLLRLELVLTDTESGRLKMENYTPSFVINRSRHAEPAYGFEKKGIRVFNPARVCEIGNDKDLSYRLADSLSLPYMPYTLMDEDVVRGLKSFPENSPLTGTYLFADISKNADSFGYPFVLKPSGGHGGRHVYLINDPEDLLGAIDNIIRDLDSFPHKKILLQKPCRVSGRDLRIYMLGNRVLASVMRSSDKDSDFRANFSLGGNARLHEPTEGELGIAEKICSALPSDFVGVDIIYDGDNVPVFNELEDAVGSRMLYACSDIDPVRLFADHIRSSLA